jgi:hypothetical protein
VAVDFRSQPGALSQLLSAQGFGGVEIGEPVPEVGGEVALAPAMAAVAVVFGKLK